MMNKYEFEVMDATIDNLNNYLNNWKDTDWMYLISFKVCFDFANIDILSLDKIIGSLDDDHKLLLIRRRNDEE